MIVQLCSKMLHYNLSLCTVYSISGYNDGTIALLFNRARKLPFSASHQNTVHYTKRPLCIIYIYTKRCTYVIKMRE